MCFFLLVWACAPSVGTSVLPLIKRRCQRNSGGNLCGEATMVWVHPSLGPWIPGIPPGLLDVLYIAGSQTKPSLFNGFCQVGVSSKARKKTGDACYEKCGWCVNPVISFAKKQHVSDFMWFIFAFACHIHLHTAIPVKHHKASISTSLKGEGMIAQNLNGSECMVSSAGAVKCHLPCHTFHNKTARAPLMNGKVWKMDIFHVPKGSMYSWCVPGECANFSSWESGDFGGWLP